jgi:hypothetical protein
VNFEDLQRDYPIAPEGAHNAVLVSWIDRGLQQGRFGARRQVGLRLELPDIESESEEPVLVFHTIFNLSLRSKTFREMAVALMGTSDLAGSSVREMVGKGCKVTIVHKETDDGQTFANIASFKTLKPGTSVRADTPPIFFSLDPADVPDLKSLQRDFDALPETERNKVSASETWRELVATRTLTQNSKGKRAAKIVKDTIPGEDDPAEPNDSFPENLPF